MNDEKKIKKQIKEQEELIDRERQRLWILKDAENTLITVPRMEKNISKCFKFYEEDSRRYAKVLAVNKSGDYILEQIDICDCENEEFFHIERGGYQENFFTILKWKKMPENKYEKVKARVLEEIYPKRKNPPPPPPPRHPKKGK